MRTRLFVHKECEPLALKSHNRQRRASEVFDKRPTTKIVRQYHREIPVSKIA